jgi:hypothetical protein
MQQAAWQQGQFPVQQQPQQAPMLQVPQVPQQGWLPWQSQAQGWAQQQPPMQQWVQAQPQIAPSAAPLPVQVPIAQPYSGALVQEPAPQEQELPITFNELLRFCAYIYAIGEAESLARLLLHLDDSPARFQQEHIADLHRAEIDNNLSAWPKELTVALLEGLTMALATLFDLRGELAPDARPLTHQPTGFPSIQVHEREGRPFATLNIEAAAELHSTLLNGSNRLQPQLAEIMQIHDEHLAHTRRMHKRMSALQSYFKPV